MSSQLDAGALGRIEAVHRGFLYQHLFAVGCLLLARTAGFRTLDVERDEDVQLVFDRRIRYVQVKTRKRPLTVDDLDSTLHRFRDITAAHSAGQRTGVPEFWVVTNSAASAALREEVRRRNLDVRFVTPHSPPPTDSHSPPAWPDLGQAFGWCIDAAGQIQFSGLSPENLTWKLATEVAFACTGDRPRGHSFRTDQLTDLFEQLVTSLHRLPAAPVPYIRQSSEPDFFTDAHVQIIVGLSGAGKTAWVAQSALHSQDTVYFDAASSLPTALASAVAREVAAHFLRHGDDRARDAILPGASGLEALAALSAFVADSGRSVRLVCDNVHSIGSEALRRLIENAPAFNWALVARPSPDVASLETYFGVRAAHLGGFSLGAVADVFSGHGCPLDVPTAEAIREISAGLPLFVNDAARLTERAYRSDPQSFVAAVRAGTHTQSTGQEVILSEVIRALSPGAQIAAALLSLSEVQLRYEECLQFVADATGDESATVAACCRELVDWGVAQQYFDASIGLHDAFGLPAATFLRRLSATSSISASSGSEYGRKMRRGGSKPPVEAPPM